MIVVSPAFPISVWLVSWSVHAIATPPEVSDVLGVAALVGLAIIIVAPMFRASIVIALGAIVIAALIGASWYLFSQYNLLLDFTYPLMTSLFVYLTLIFVNYFQEQKQRQQIRAAFGYYLSPALVEQLARSPEKLVL